MIDGMIVMVTGVTGSGKTTIGSLLARELGWRFADGDDFHPPANIEKMRRGIGLTDTDRAPWLNAIHDAMLAWQSSGTSAVVACSALKHAYRELLRQNIDLKMVYLRGEAGFIKQRLQQRSGHYAKADLVDSQFDDLEEPHQAVTVGIAGEPEEIVAEIRRRLGLA